MSVSSSVAVYNIVPEGPEKPTAKLTTGPCFTSIQPSSHLQFISTYEYYLRYNLMLSQSMENWMYVLRKLAELYQHNELVFHIYEVPFW